MPRKLVETSDFFPYHICARSNNRDWFELPLAQVFGIYANLMEDTIRQYKIHCHAFTLMANHYHMLVSTPQANISQAMRYFMTESSRAIARGTKRINHIYGSRYRWTIIGESTHYAHAYFYVYRNPIKHGVVTHILDYPWSTIDGWHRKFKGLIQTRRDGFEEHIPSEQSELISWINQKIDPQYEESLQKALRRHTFRFPKNKLGKRPSFIDMLRPKKVPGTLAAATSCHIDCFRV